MTPDELREKVARAICKAENGACLGTCSCTYWDCAADDAIAVVLGEAARVAEREGVYPELNIANGGPDWYRHGQRIATAIRALKGEKKL